MTVAVLCSGGLDSAVLVAEEAAQHSVQPIYVSAGLAWEDAERHAVARFLEDAALPRVRPLVSLSVTQVSAPDCIAVACSGLIMLRLTPAVMRLPTLVERRNSDMMKLFMRSGACL